MRGPIEARIAALRGQVRRLLALHGLSRLVFGLAAAVLAAGSADWLIHLVPEVRLVLLVGVVGAGGLAGRSAGSSCRWSSGSPTSTSPCGSRSAGRA